MNEGTSSHDDIVEIVRRFNEENPDDLYLKFNLEDSETRERLTEFIMNTPIIDKTNKRNFEIKYDN